VRSKANIVSLIHRTVS